MTATMSLYGTPMYTQRPIAEAMPMQALITPAIERSGLERTQSMYIVPSIVTTEQITEKATRMRKEHTNLRSVGHRRRMISIEIYNNQSIILPYLGTRLSAFRFSSSGSVCEWK
ncbi:hypothetical protein PMAYCL1PPCAC_21885 [Pristionchus mayeri]|uniref:Uncharacterized protein n=1 Tax=Pristionchus mayeri TaxID=1317129 RepID=A0AAN5I523_9BILA|nr:hypothetical protein PMAYCL1PPCAC_21885 [Pristionchus mayeri]